MIKLQFLDTTRNLLVNFHIEKIGLVLLFNFLAWYKALPYTANASWPMKLKGDIFNLMMWLYLKTISGPYITYQTRD